MKTKRLLSLLLALVFAFSVCPVAFAENAQEPEYRNVILMIGDGMGENHLEMAREHGAELFMDTNYDLRGQSKTSSASHITTDSGAGGTALSCGMRVINQTIGVAAFDPTGMLFRPVSITENAQAHGMRTGIVTTDKTSGATPGDFSVHVIYRKQYEKIAQQQLESKLDLIWGGADGNVTAEDAEAHGFTYVTTRRDLTKLRPGERSFAQFSGSTWRPNISSKSSTPTLEFMTKRAIYLLNHDNPNGFFLMVECGHIDSVSHRSDGLKMDYPEKVNDAVDAVIAFDNAVHAAVDFARRDGETLVVVTADHETGNIYYDGGRYKYHYDEHTAKNVPLFVYCSTDLIENGEKVKNSHIPRRIAAKLGWSESEFPRIVLGPALQFMKKET